MSEDGEGNSPSHDENQSFHQNDESSKYKSLLIVNDSTGVRITLYLYPSWFPFCKVSKNSIIIQQKEEYLHRQKHRFKFKLVAYFDDERKKTELLGPVKLVQDKLIRVTETLDCIEENLDDHPQEKRICLRKMHFRNELTSTSGKVTWYDFLGLDMKVVRRLNIDEQKKTINKAYREKIRIWHPDKNFGDREIAQLINKAKDILLDDEKRGRYHDEVDRDKEWLSIMRYIKAKLWSKRDLECFTEEQKEAYACKLRFLCLSGLAFVVGIGLTALTAGAAAPAVVVCGAVFGGGLTGAGMLSGMDTISKKSFECNLKSWLLKAGVGFLGGVITGGAAVSITAGVVGIGSAALESSAVTLGQYAGIGAASGSVGGVASSLATDAARKFVDGEEVTWKECLGHAFVGGIIGAVTGALGGLATKGIVNRQTTAGSVALEGEVVEQAAILTGARRFGYPLAQSITRKLTESGTEAVMGTAAGFIEERLDDSVENQHPMEHVKNGAIKVVANVGKTMVSGAVEVAAASINHAKNELAIRKRIRGKTFENKYEKRNFRRTTRHTASVKNKENVINWRSTKGSGGYERIAETHELCEEIPKNDDETSNVPDETERSETTVETNHEIIEDGGSYGTSEEEPAEDPQDGTIRYKSEGYWFSKMVVTYSLNGKENKQEVSGNGRKIKIPSGARQIEVRFQVRRPFWGDIMKYDRFKETWCKPYEPHVFRYEKPPLERTFTISGNLRWEAVMTVSDEYHEETGEMC